MSKRQFKSQASSSRAGGAGFAFGGFSATTSTLSYLSEPADLSSISDPNIVVAFKNLLKKDSTTKSKALEDLRAFVQAHPFEQDGGVEQAVLDAWVRQYPRTAIDNSRRVRELSHNLQYELLRSARKRMERHIPGIVGAWLAGTYDRDRPVARAASDGITSFLDTEEKVLAFWRRCQSRILSYAQEAIQETPQTLSDERAVNTDEMQTKYDRVIGSSLSLVVSLLSKLGMEDIAKHQEDYEAFLAGNKALWKFVAAEDSFVRKIASQLLLVALEKQTDIILQDAEIVGSAFITDGLKASQSGSVVQFLQAIITLTVKCPESWTTAYKSKRSPLSRLQMFVEKGSQAGPAEYWRLWGGLLKRLPTGVLPTHLTGVQDLLRAQRRGISHREEPRANAETAWNSYIDVVALLSSKLSEPSELDTIVVSEVYPVFEQYLRPSADNTIWSMGNSSTALARAFALCSKSSNLEALKAEWSRLADFVVETMLVSLPEKSKDHAKSQNAVIAEAQRWFTLQAEILKLDSSEATLNLLAETSGSILDKATDTLESRNGKPFGAAGILDAALRLTPKLITSRAATIDEIVSFFEEDLPKLVASPSSSYLIAALNALRSLPDQQGAYEAIWLATVKGLLTTPDGLAKRLTMKSLVASPATSSLAQGDSTLQEYLKSVSERAIDGDKEAYGVFENAISFDAFTPRLAEDLIIKTVDALGSQATELDVALQMLELVAQRKPALLIDTSLYLALTTRLLSIGEVADENLSSRINTLRATIEKSSDGTSTELAPVVQIIQTGLENASATSLSIDTLVAQATTAFLEKDDCAVTDLYPRVDVWSRKSLAPLLSYVPNPALALSNPLGGAVFLVESPSTTASNAPDRDLSGYSVAFRKALYTSKLINTSDSFEKLPLELRVELLQLLCLTVEIANDQLGLQESNQLWSSMSNPASEAEIEDFLSSTQQILNSLVKESSAWRNGAESGSVIGALILRLLEDTSGSSPATFYHARALSTLLTNAVELHGWQSAGGEEWLTALGVLKSTTSDVFKATSVLIGLKNSLESSKLINNLCNRLISDIAGASSKSQRKTASQLVYLNAIMSVYEIGDLPVAQNRLVFAVRQITSWMEENPMISAPLAAEALKSLQHLFPCISGVYGSHWNASLKFSVQSLVGPEDGERLDSRLPLYHASMKHVSLCRKMLEAADVDEINDDLQEALSTNVSEVPQALLELLTIPRVKENQPWIIVDELLCRELEILPNTAIKDPEDLYYLLASDTRLIQSAVFGLLQRHALANAETINYDAVLEKKAAALPQELLSLLLAPPTSESFPEEDLVQFPAMVRSYLLTWHVVFDHFVNASAKVREDYTSTLRGGNYIEPLLNFIFDVLGHSLAQALNLDKARIGAERRQAYDITQASSETNEYDMQWLLVNLYYQSLRYLPGPTKAWWVDNRSKQTRLAVESWTEKYISPLLISSTLDEVATWAQQQEAPADDEKELIVKVSKRSKEVYAGYEVDDMQAQILIRLPSTYPLEGVQVESVNRVAVSEKKWQSWLMTTKGAITLNNAPITDGLTNFRRNITASLKGQTECAICYSIVSSDKKMPEKKCQTCKNLFHSDCLFKWFASSNQSTCPLCRNFFNYSEVGSRRRGGGGGREDAN